MTQCNSATMSMTKSRICSSRNCFWNSISFHSSSIRLVNFTLFCVLIPIIITTLSKICGLWSLSLALCLIHGLLLFENCKKMYLFTHQKCHEMWWFGSGAAGAFHLSMYLCMRWQSNSCSWNDFNRNWEKKYENSHANTLTYVHTDTIAAQTRWLKNVVCGVRACIHQFIFYTFFFHSFACSLSFSSLVFGLLIANEVRTHSHMCERMWWAPIRQSDITFKWTLFVVF